MGYTKNFFLVGLLVFISLNTFGQVVKFKTPSKKEGITVKTLPNGSQNPRWKQVIFKESVPVKSNSLITDALMVDFGTIDQKNKSIELVCTGGFEAVDIELFFVGDTDFFSIDIDTVTNVWQKYHETVFKKEALKDVKIKIRAKNLQKGDHKAFIAFRIGKQLYRVAVKSFTKETIITTKEDVNINLGLVEADSVGFTDYRFINLGELPLEVKYSGDSSAFVFSIDGDTVYNNVSVIPSSDTLTLSIAPIAKQLGDKYGELIFKNNYVEQHLYLTSAVTKIRGEVYWKDTLHALSSNLAFEKKILYTPLDTLWLSASLFNDSDYDTLYRLDSLIEFKLPKWLQYNWTEERLLPRSNTAFRIPVTLKKEGDLSKNLKGKIKVEVLEDFSSIEHNITYKPQEKLLKEIHELIPEKLQFTSLTDTFEIKVPFLNTGRNSVYPSVKRFIKETNKPRGIQVYYGSSRIKPWKKGYISIFLTPYDSINFHQTKVDTLSFQIYGEKTITEIEIIQEPWDEIIKDYTTEIIVAILLIILIVLGILSPKIIEMSKRKYAQYQKEQLLKHQRVIFKEMEDLMTKSNIENLSFKEGLDYLKKELDSKQ